MTKMPKAKPDVGYSKEKMRVVKCLIQSVTDVWQERDKNPEENRQRWYTRLLSG